MRSAFGTVYKTIPDPVAIIDVTAGELAPWCNPSRWDRLRAGLTEHGAAVSDLEVDFASGDSHIITRHICQDKPPIRNVRNRKSNFATPIRWKPSVRLPEV